MLTRGRALVVLACSAAMLLPHPALADGKPPVVTVTGDAVNGAINTAVTSPGSPGAQSSGAAGSSSSSNDSGVTCTWKAESTYSQQLFQWIGSNPDGTWYDVICSDGSVYAGVYVPPSAGNIPPAVVLAGTLARTAANQLPLPTPRAQHNPTGDALVGLATWWWVDPAAWQPLRQRTQAGPVWAEVTATPVSTTWDAGDGSAPVTCAGPGTAYDASLPESQQSTDCSHTYRRSSADQPQTGPSVNDRFFTVTVTTSWQVTWNGPAGSGGTLPVLTTSSSFPLAVAQRQTVVTGGSG
jgi:hypothetical protein